MQARHDTGVVFDLSPRRIRVVGGPDMCALSLGAMLAARLALGGVTFEFEASPEGVTLRTKTGGVTWDVDRTWAAISEIVTLPLEAVQAA